MGNKSKFTFPVPGRPSKAPPLPKLSITTPLSKAQKILGTGGINIDTPISATKSNGPIWDTASNSGISISVSESSASQATSDTGYGGFDELDTAATSYDRSQVCPWEEEPSRNEVCPWEQESAIIPRQLSSAHGPTTKQSLRPKRSAATVGEDYRDGATDASFAHRRDSISSVWTHYEASKMPLSISQQTSNSAMAKGYSMKAGALLEVDDASRRVHGKKKPAKLNISRLRGKPQKQQRADAAESESILGNSHIVGLPSFVSQASETPVSPQETTHKATRKLMGVSPLPHRAPGIKGVSRDYTGLNQLYDHYEQMSFRDAPFRDIPAVEEEETDEEPQEVNPELLQPGVFSPPWTTAPASTRSFITPLVHPAAWKHSRNDSQESRATQNTVLTRPASKKDYAASNSVLSLSDSSDEDDLESASASAFSRKGSTSRDESGDPARYRQPGPVAGVDANGHANRPRNSQLSAHLAIPSDSSRPQVSHPANYLAQSSNHASMSTAASGISIPRSGSDLDQIILQQATHRASHQSRASEQPTPPISPNSLEFCPPPSERDDHQDAVAHQQAVHNARMMAVTRQEEMLLAALRKKRARMRESIIAELGDDRHSRSSRGSGSMTSDRGPSVSGTHGPGERPEATAPTTTREARPPAPTIQKVPARRSSLSRGPGDRQPWDRQAHAGQRSQLAGILEQEASRSSTDDSSNNNHPTKNGYASGAGSSSRGAAAPAPAPARQGSQTSGHERVLLYLDQPLDGLDPGDAAEPSPDLSEFLDAGDDSDGDNSDEDMLAVGGSGHDDDRRGSSSSSSRRMRHQNQDPGTGTGTGGTNTPRFGTVRYDVGSIDTGVRDHGHGHGHGHGRPRPDSTAVSPVCSLAPRGPPPQMLLPDVPPGKKKNGGTGDNNNHSKKADARQMPQQRRYREDGQRRGQQEEEDMFHDKFRLDLEDLDGFDMVSQMPMPPTKSNSASASNSTSSSLLSLSTTGMEAAAAAGREGLPDLGAPPQGGDGRGGKLLHPRTAAAMPRPGHRRAQKSAVRLSAVGNVNSSMPWWGDDD
ncbi:hypothetical protein GGR56DRAFT_673970 [Xylariaceae sp. FL0804]|nr:hypothetical protein GGR56DRAFT_673970 [Xylariaceae sp. FL0804]